MSPKSGVVILGNEYQALGHLRFLASEGIRCVLVDQDKHGPALYSKFKKEFFISPAYTSEHFWPWLKALAAKQNLIGWIIIPTDDEQVRQLSQNYDEVSRVFKHYIPHWDEYKNIYDKRLAYEWASKIGIDLPRTYAPMSKDDITAHGLTPPFILKPAIKREFNKFSKKKAITITSNEQLERILANEMRKVPIEHLILQEIIPGDGEQQWSYAGFFVKGAPVAAYTACRKRQHPLDYGRASTCVVATYNSEVEELGQKVIGELNYTGLAEMEFKRDVRDRKLKFLEVNARSWGWHSLSKGVVGNLTKVLYDFSCTGAYSYIPPRYGARWVKWITDIPVLCDLLVHRKLRIRDYLSEIGHDLVSCEWDYHDPKPLFFQVFLLPYLILKRGY